MWDKFDLTLWGKNQFVQYIWNKKKKKKITWSVRHVYENLLTSLSLKQKYLHQDSGQSKHHWRCLFSSLPSIFRHPFISHTPDGLRKRMQHKCKRFTSFSRQLGGSTLGSWVQFVFSSVVTSEVGTQKTHNAPAALWFSRLISAVCWGSLVILCCSGSMRRVNENLCTTYLGFVCIGNCTTNQTAFLYWFYSCCTVQWRINTQNNSRWERGRKKNCSD